MESKHTPGPWRFEATTKTIRAVPSNYWLASMNSWDGAVDNAANARLIAAAPDLLAALELSMPWRMRDGSLCCCPAGRDESEPHGEMPVVHSTVCAAARSALAKARGE